MPRRRNPTLQFRSAEILDNVLPVGRVVISAQIWLQLAAQNLERSTLSNTVGAYQTQNLAGARRRQSVKLEAVGRVPMGNLRLEVGWQIDNGDGSEWALLWANTTSNT